MLDEARIKMVEITGGGFNGKHHTEESKEAIRQKMNNRIITDEHRKKMSDSSGNKRKVVMLDKNTEEFIMEFESMKLACEWLHLNTKYNKAKSSEISSVCSSKKKSAYGYKWKYIENLNIT